MSLTTPYFAENTEQEMPLKGEAKAPHENNSNASNPELYIAKDSSLADTASYSNDTDFLNPDNLLTDNLW